MKKKKNELSKWTKALIIAFFLAVFIRCFLFTPIVVNGHSMMPTLHDGDRIIVNKMAYSFGKPKRFDIIVFHATKRKDYIKRIIGLPGDRIEYKDDTLFINGEKFEEPYLDEMKKEQTDGPLTYSFKLEETAVESETVPEGLLFVMGDNRKNSTDSRHIGAIPINKVIGKASVIYWPSLRIIK